MEAERLAKLAAEELGLGGERLVHRLLAPFAGPAANRQTP